MARSLTKRAIIRYATNWLSQHGSLPEGVHRCRSRCTTGIAYDIIVEVDFTRQMSDPDYPGRHGPVTSKFSETEALDMLRRARRNLDRR